MADIYETWGSDIQIRVIDPDQNVDPMGGVYDQAWECTCNVQIQARDPDQRMDPMADVYEQACDWGSDNQIQAPDPDQNMDPVEDVYELACDWRSDIKIKVPYPDQNMDPVVGVYEPAWGSDIQIEAPDPYQDTDPMEEPFYEQSRNSGSGIQIKVPYPDQNLDPVADVYEQAWGSNIQIQAPDPDQNIDPRLWIPLRERRGREGFETTGRGENVRGRSPRDDSPALVLEDMPGGRDGGTSDAPDDPGPAGPDTAPGGAQPVEVLNPLYASDLPPGNIRNNAICVDGLSLCRLVCIAMTTIGIATLMTSVPFAMMDTGIPDNAEAATIVRTPGHQPGWQTSQPVMKNNMAAAPPVTAANPLPGREKDKPTPVNGPVPMKTATGEEKVDGGTRREVVKIRTYGSEPRESSPRGVDVSIDNEIYITDSIKRLVQVYNMRGVHLRQYPMVLPGGATMKPWDVSVNPDGHLWVVGSDNSHDEHVVQYARNGRLTSSFGIGNSLYINGIATDPRNNRVIVTCSDGYKGRLEIYHPNGYLLMSLGPEERMSAPLYVAVNDEGTILASDTRSYNVFAYAETGQFLFKFGGYQAGEGSMYRPKGLCVTAYGDIVVADQGNQRLVVFTSRGEYLREIPTGMRSMQGVAAGPGGQLVVVDPDERVVTIFPGY
ncbi:uncharacterized protein [Branchiostoma lanceolatum]|uniref:uncharacterized protein n=1 Tax=Branchiostoma lanceolatum TaxID=7740 RepID=UPI003455ED61